MVYIGWSRFVISCLVWRRLGHQGFKTKDLSDPRVYKCCGERVVLKRKAELRERQREGKIGLRKEGFHWSDSFGLSSFGLVNIYEKEMKVVFIPSNSKKETFLTLFSKFDPHNLGVT